MSGIKVIHR